ncbi:MAG: RNA polymerase sigma factor [Kiritimatiellia bacterium]
MTEDGQQLLAYARRGDVMSLSALVVRNTTWLKAFLRGLTASDVEAEDAFQEVWVRVIKGCRSFRGGSVRAYLARIARTVVIDRFRRNGRPTCSLDAVGENGVSLAETLVDGAPSPSAVLELRGTAEEVRRAVRTLPEGPRTVLLMRIEGELSFREIAEELGIPLGTALTWMHVATVRLRKSLGGKS